MTATTNAIKQLAGDLVPDKDVDQFSRLLADAINLLHEGSVARYRIKRAEYILWKSGINAGG